MAAVRPNSCKLNKNFCCAVCCLQPECLITAKKDVPVRGKRVLPCGLEFLDGCDCAEEIE